MLTEKEKQEVRPAIEAGIELEEKEIKALKAKIKRLEKKIDFKTVYLAGLRAAKGLLN